LTWYLLFVLTLLSFNLSLKSNFFYKFNYTRIIWSKGYACNYRDIDEMNILIISGTFIVATIAFYIIVRLIVQEEKRHFIQIRKLNLLFYQVYFMKILFIFFFSNSLKSTQKFCLIKFIFSLVKWGSFLC
jgi:hypothetical protein